jgi:hypothetical protein
VSVNYVVTDVQNKKQNKEDLFFFLYLFFKERKKKQQSPVSCRIQKKSELHNTYTHAQ